MRKRTRTTLFFSLFFIFILLTPAVILYSQGYRFDFEKKKITQTGGIFLRVEPKQAEIYINGKLTKKTDFFFGSALIENLLPQKYKVEVKKDGEQKWQKELAVKEKIVTEVKSIILFPEKYDFSLLGKNIENFWPFPDGEKIVFLEKNSQTWALKLYDLKKNIKSHLIEEKNIYSKGAELLSLEFSKNSKEIYLAVGFKEQEKNFVLNLDKIPPVLTEKTQKLNNEIYYLDKLGFVFRDKTKINQESFPVKEETEYKIKAFPDYLFLQEAGAVYLLNPELRVFEKFSDEMKDLKISPDNKKLAFFSSSEIWVLFLEEETEAPQKKASEKLFLLRLSEKIGDVFWLNNDYLIFNSGNNIKIAEIDDRDKIQTWEIGSFPSPQIFFNPIDKKLYILSEGSLYNSESLF